PEAGARRALLQRRGRWIQVPRRRGSRERQVRERGRRNPTAHAFLQERPRTRAGGEMFVPVKDTTGRESRHAPRRDDADTGQHSGHHGECHEAMNTAAGWERYARERPEFAVLTDGTTGSAFFASGERAVEERLHVVRALGYTVGPRALDLGCGMGRLSLALALHFQEVIGVDHSRTMIGLARTRAIEAQVSNARFFESDGGGL